MIEIFHREGEITVMNVIGSMDVAAVRFRVPFSSWWDSVTR